MAFQVLMAVLLYHHTLFPRGLLIDLMMEAVSTSETSVNFYEITRRNIPEDSHIYGK
jgi:hypothetical protein